MTGEFERGDQRDHNHNEKYTIVLYCNFCNLYYRYLLSTIILPGTMVRLVHTHYIHKLYLK